ncbi:MAG: hypothetical protein KDI09_09065 [Halioglobus sp.]|nr:hypothetical protein [Halioglobus sp.]
MFAINLVAGLWLTLSASVSVALPMLSLNPSSATLSLNEAFTIDVLLSGVEVSDPLLAFGFDIATGAGPVFVGSSVAAPFFDDSGAFAATDVAGSALPAVSGDDILLATLSLTAGSIPGLWDITLSSAGAEFAISEGLFTLGQIIPVQSSITVEVLRSTAVPAPSALLLLVLALGILLHWRHR